MEWNMDCPQQEEMPLGEAVGRKKRDGEAGRCRAEPGQEGS